MACETEVTPTQVEEILVEKNEVPKAMKELDVKKKKAMEPDLPNIYQSKAQSNGKVQYVSLIRVPRMTGICDRTARELIEFVSIKKET